MVCEPCKCEGRDGPSKQWEVRLRGDITILLTPGVFPMPHQRAAVDWMHFKECLFSTQSIPHPGYLSISCKIQPQAPRVRYSQLATLCSPICLHAG